MKRSYQVLLGVLVLALVAVGVWWFRLAGTATPLAKEKFSSIVAATAPPAAAVASSAPMILHPIEAASSPDGPPADAATTLAALFGQKTVDALLIVDAFPERFVATIDNLGRATASPRLWPARPAPGRFSVDETAGRTVISADNGLRYAPYLIAFEALDLPSAVRAYKRSYPALQKKYESLGYPNDYFNDRFVAVIDSMLATPEPGAPLAVHLPHTEDSAKPARPWLLYEFDDPALAALPAGQKLLLRMGPVGERRVKARLRELRALLAPAAN